MADESIIELRTAAGSKLGEITRFEKLTYARGVNRTGKLVLSMPPTMSTDELIQFTHPDRRLNVLRSIDGAQPFIDLESAWFVRALELRDDDGKESYVLEAVDSNILLDWRIVAYYAESAQSERTLETDDFIKALVRENLASTASDYGGATDRGLASTLFRVQPDMTRGVSCAKALAWRNLGSALIEIAEFSRERGTYLAFDIVVADHLTGMLELRTYTGQRGIDRRHPGGNRPLILSRENGTLKNPRLRYDFSREVTHAYAGGQGQAAARVMAQAYDAQRRKASPFNRREVFVNASGTDDPAVILDEARAAVYANRPRIYLTGELVETNQTRRGVHWEWGDLLTAEAFGVRNDYAVDSIEVTVDKDGTRSNKVVLQQYEV